MPVDSQYFRLLISTLYKVTAELTALFPGRTFEPTGELADLLAESMAECHYGVRPKVENGQAPADDEAVTVKAAQSGKIRLQGWPPRLLVLRLYRNGTFDEIYNGPGDLVRRAIAPGARRLRTGHSVPLTLLRELMRDVPQAERLPRSPRAEGQSLQVVR